MENSKLKPALIGGGIAGILTIIPFLNLANVCCCLWIVTGGALASYLYINKAANRVAIGEGAMLGGITGLVASAIYIVIGIPVALVTRGLTESLLVGILRNLDANAARQMEIALEQAQKMPLGQWLVQTVLSALLVSLVIIVMSVIGGILGVVIFEKRKEQAGMPPVPPPDFGNMPR